MTAPHTPYDSLLFLDAASSLLEWVGEEAAGAHGDDPDPDAIVDAVLWFARMIRAELDVHGPRRSRYSTGHSVLVEQQQRGIEPDPDGGPDHIVMQTVIRTCYPDGQFDHPVTRRRQK